MSRRQLRPGASAFVGGLEHLASQEGEPALEGARRRSPSRKTPGHAALRDFEAEHAQLAVECAAHPRSGSPMPSDVSRRTGGPRLAVDLDGGAARARSNSDENWLGASGPLSRV